MKAIIALEDGTIIPTRSFTGAGEALGEMVFNTSMSGYQEILSDPSSAGQLVTMTYPLIGNSGVNPQDMESDTLAGSFRTLRFRGFAGAAFLTGDARCREAGFDSARQRRARVARRNATRAWGDGGLRHLLSALGAAIKDCSGVPPCNSTIAAALIAVAAPH